MNAERLAKIVVTAAIAVTPALTAVAATAVPAMAAGIHAAAPAGVTVPTSIIEIVARDEGCCTQGDSTNSGCSF